MISQDLISTQLFLVLASDDIDLQTFDNRLITFIVLHVFEHHAGKVEAVRCVVNVWILALLNLHTWSMHHNELLPGIIWVAVRFLAAQSAVDILWEAIQIYGYAAIGQPWEYWSVGNLLDFCAAVVPTYLWLDPSNHPVLATRPHAMEVGDRKQVLLPYWKSWPQTSDPPKKEIHL